MRIEFSTPTIFAHRGSSLEAPENTLAAFQLAVDQGAHGIELDAQLTADGQVVVIHDHSVDRTTNGTGLVAELSLEEIKTLDAGSHLNESFRNETIPTLDEVFENFGKQILINVELKNDTAPFNKLAEKVAQVVSKHKLESQLLFSSFNPFALRSIKHHLPDSYCGQLTIPGIYGSILSYLDRIVVKCEALHPASKAVTSELIQEQHEAGKRIHAYTVNHPMEMLKLFKLGIDGIFTDNPKLALQVLATFESTNSQS